MNLYHVSPVRNHAAIAHTGIEPAFSRGKSKTAWFVDWQRVGWALAHCSSKHKTPVDELEIWIIDAGKARKMSRTRLPGVFQTPCFHRTIGTCSASRAFAFFESGTEPEIGGLHE